MPFLSIVTRHHPRSPDLLDQCKASIAMQKDQDFEHILLYDEESRGIPYANRMFFNNRHLVTGKYVFILDSDDVFVTDMFISDMKKIAKEHNDPEIIFIRMIINGLLHPTDIIWKKEELIKNHIGSSCFIMKNELWQENIDRFEPKRTGDFFFIEAAFSKKPTVYWHDRTYSKTLSIGRLVELHKEECETIPLVADEVVTGVVVVQNTLELIKRAYESIRFHHPNIKIVIIDGSDRLDPCYPYIASLSSPITKPIQVGYNIGHGKGLDLGISQARTPYILTFDSDIEMIKSPIQAMLEQMEDDTYGIGYIEQTDIGGYEFRLRRTYTKYGPVRYLHPYFSLIQLKEYKNYAPFVHHGAPHISSCLDIRNKGLSDKIIKSFPGLGHTAGHGDLTNGAWRAVKIEYIRHSIAGTRNIRKSLGLPSIEMDWEATITENEIKKALIIEDISMKDSITCITPTGDRPEAFALCRKWMESQTLQPTQWIVVDDGKTPLPTYLIEGVEYIRREPVEDEKFTININLQTALPYIKGEKILIIEDDDWYGPEYIKTMNKLLSKYDLVGEGLARYYHLKSMRYGRILNKFHTSLCQTGFVKSLLPAFKDSIPGDPYIDTRFWENIKENKYVFLDPDDRLHLHCSMKGLKGRLGIGSGHTENSFFYKYEDKDQQQLINWVGIEGARLYTEHFNKLFIQSEGTVRPINIRKKVVRKNSWRDRLQLVQARIVAN